MGDYKIGDIVQLKSGGPKMTCSGHKSVTTGNLEYVWFAGSKKESGYFATDMLNLVKDEKESKEKQ
jgi:uncharacterized protein YodC (DUF2158 family)